MDPISIGIGIVGLGMQLFGGLSAASNSRQQAQVSGQITGDEQQVQAQKQQQMQLEASRNELETFRKQQRTMAQAQAGATNQGAQFGSGLQGGLAEITNQSLFNAQGINQNVEIGKNIFSIDSDISAKKIQLANLGGQAATDQGIASLGNAVVKAGPTIGSFARNVGSSGGMFMGGGSPSGYGTG